MTEALLRRIILQLADDPALRAFVTRHGRRLGAYRFVAGETLTEAVPEARALNAAGITVTLDALGESVGQRSEAEEARDRHLEVLAVIAEEGLQSTVSLKLSQLGLDIDHDFCRENTAAVVARAASLGNHVQIAMEDSSRTSATLRIFEELHGTFGDHVGVVLQAYLYRSRQDLERLIARRATVRIVKGAYREPPSVAFPWKADVDRNYLELCREAMQAGSYTCVATHDEAIIDAVKEFAARHRIAPERFEFQMLYGVRSRLQRELVRQGYRVRCYVPFGRDWYPYFMRRLAERPANLLFFVQNLVRD